MAYLRKLAETVRQRMTNADACPPLTIYLAETSMFEARAFSDGTLVFSRGLLDMAASEAAPNCSTATRNRVTCPLPHQNPALRFVDDCESDLSPTPRIGRGGATRDFRRPAFDISLLSHSWPKCGCDAGVQLIVPVSL